MHHQRRRAEHAVEPCFCAHDITDVVQHELVELCAGRANQSEVSEEIPLAAKPWREPQRARAPQQPFPGKRDFQSRPSTSLRWFCERNLRKRSGLRRHLEEWILLESEYLRGHVGGEPAARRVVLLYSLVVAHAFDRDAVFGARQLVHQAVELLVGSKLRVVFGDQEQPAERSRLLVGSRNRFFRCLRGEQSRACVGDLREHTLFVLSVTLDGLDEIGNEVVAPLKLILDLRPLSLDRFFLADELVVRTAGQWQGSQQCDELDRRSSRHAHILRLQEALPACAAATSAASPAAETAEASAEPSAAEPSATETSTTAKAAAPSAAKRSDAARPAAAGSATPVAVIATSPAAADAAHDENGKKEDQQDHPERDR